AGASTWAQRRRARSGWRRSVLPWAGSAALLLALGWAGLWRGHGTPSSAGPMRFSVELEPGVQPSFTPIVRLSPDGRQLFVTAMVDRREEVLRRRFDELRMEVIAGAGQGDQGTGNSRPFVSPDGQWIAYAKQGKLRKVRVDGGVFGFYVPSGHLLYAAGETIRGVPFDVNRLAVTGPAVPVLDSVAMNPTDGAAAFDVSENGTLAYLPVSSYVTETDMVMVDRRGHETRALPTRDRYNHPRL